MMLELTFFDLVFYCFAAVLLLAALRVVTARNPVHAALYLVLAFFSAAGVWVLLEAEFLAISLVLVYVGAVMVLFLFVVMMLDIDIERLRLDFWQTLPLGGALAGVMVLELILLLGTHRFGAREVGLPPSHAANYSNTLAVGRELFTHYLWVFELAALVLLVAMIAAIVLTHRARQDVKRIAVGEQVQANKANRLHILKMDAVQKDKDTP